MLYYAAVTLYILICFLLLVVVLLQQGKGGDIAAAFGGSSSQTAFGARAGATVLTRATTVLASLFMIGGFVLGVMGRGGSGSSVVGGVEPPASSQPAAPALPTDPIPVPPPPTGGGKGGTLPETPPPVEPGKTAPAPGKKGGGQ